MNVCTKVTTDFMLLVNGRRRSLSGYLLYNRRFADWAKAEAHNHFVVDRLSGCAYLVHKLFRQWPSYLNVQI